MYKSLKSYENSSFLIQYDRNLSIILYKWQLFYTEDFEILILHDSTDHLKSVVQTRQIQVQIH